MKFKFVIILCLLSSCSTNKEESSKQKRQSINGDLSIENNHDAIEKKNSIDYTTNLGKKDLINDLFVKSDSFLFETDQNNQLKFLLKEESYQAYALRKDFKKFKNGNTSGLILIVNQGISNEKFKESIDELKMLRSRADNEKTLHKVKAGFIIVSMLDFSVFIFINQCTKRKDFERIVKFLETKKDISELLISHCGFY